MTSIKEIKQYIEDLECDRKNLDNFPSTVRFVYKDIETLARAILEVHDEVHELKEKIKMEKL